MKFLFTITLNCVLLVLVSEAYPRYESSAKEALRRLIKIEVNVITHACEIGYKIEQVSCGRLHKKFSNDLGALKNAISEVIEDYLEYAKVDDHKFCANAKEIDDLTAINEEIEEELQHLESDVDSAIKAQDHPSYYEPSAAARKATNPVGTATRKATNPVERKASNEEGTRKFCNKEKLDLID